MPQRKNISACVDINASTSQNQDNLIQQNNKCSQEINTSKYKKRKIETKSIDDTFTDISSTLINFLENSKENTDPKTPDQSFAEYVRSHLEHISEPEKT